jgi:hypothetical protein
MTKMLIRNPSGAIEMELAPTKPGRKPKATPNSGKCEIS